MAAPAPALEDPPARAEAPTGPAPTPFARSATSHRRRAKAHRRLLPYPSWRFLSFRCLRSRALQDARLKIGEWIAVNQRVSGGPGPGHARDEQVWRGFRL